MNLMLLCAGEGTRLRPATLKAPKPVLPFLGAPLASYSLEWAREVGVASLIVNTFHLHQQIHKLFDKIDHGAGHLFYSDEQPNLLGSGGGLVKARPHLEGDFLLMNGDEVFLPSRHGFLSEARNRHRQEDRLATLFVMKHIDVGGKFGGVWTDTENRVKGFGKNSIGDAVGWHYIGAAILSPRVFNYLPKSGISNILYDGLVAALAKKESVIAEPVQGWWRETGNLEDFLEASGDAIDLLNSVAAERALLKDVLNRQCPDWKLRGRHLSWPKSYIPASAKLDGFTVVAGGAGIGDGATLKNSVMAPGTRLKAGEVMIDQLLL